MITEQQAFRLKKLREEIHQHISELNDGYLPDHGGEGKFTIEFPSLTDDELFGTEFPAEYSWTLSFFSEALFEEPHEIKWYGNNLNECLSEAESDLRKIIEDE